VVDFFSDAPKLPRNQAITDAAKTMERVFEYSAKFRRRPSCKMYYVTTGTWRDDAALTGASNEMPFLAEELVAHNWPTCRWLWTTTGDNINSGIFLRGAGFRRRQLSRVPLRYRFRFPLALPKDRLILTRYEAVSSSS